jgi:hypothetical protein
MLFDCDTLLQLKCLNPPLTRMPKGDWYCRDCLLKSPARIRHSSDGRSCKQVTSTNTGNVARRQQDQQLQGISKTDWPLSIMASDKHAQKHKTFANNKGSSNSRPPKQSANSIPRVSTATAAVAKTSSSTKPNASNHRTKQQQFQDNKALVAAALAGLPQPQSLSSTKRGKDDVEKKGSKKRKNRTEPPAGEGTKNKKIDSKRSQQQQQLDCPKPKQQNNDKKPKQKQGKKSSIPNVGTSDQPIALLDDSSFDDGDDAENRPAKRSKQPPSAGAAAANGTAKQNGDRVHKTANKEKDSNKVKKRKRKEVDDKDLYTVIVPVTAEGLLIKIANVKIGVIFTGYRRFQNGDVGPVEAANLFRDRGDLIVSVDGTWIVDKTWEETQRLLTQHNGRSERKFVVKAGAGKDYFDGENNTSSAPASKRQQAP